MVLAASRSGWTRASRALVTRFLAVFSVLAALVVWLPGIAHADSGPALVGCTNANSACSYPADYSGGQQKNWAELDWVPFAYRTTSTTSTAYELGGDYKSADGIIGYFHVNVTGFSSGCTANPTVSAETISSDQSNIYRTVTVAALPGQTCVIFFENRLAIGAHNYPGGSLHARWVNGANTEVSINPQGILPQQLALTANATTTPSYTWALSTSGATSGVSINSCLPASTTPNASYTVSYTRQLQPGAVSTVTGNLTLTNPARVALYWSATLTVTDSSSATVGGPRQLTDGGTPVPAATSSTSPGSVVVPYSIATSASTGTLTVSATVTYYSDAAHTDSLGTLTQTASSAVSQSQNPAVGGTATVTDAESASSNLVFERTAPQAMSAFAASDSFTQTETDSGSFAVSKIIAAATPGNYTGTLSNVVSLAPSSGGSVTGSSSSTVSIPVTVTAADPTVQITKTVDVAPTGTPATFTFTIKSNDNPAQSWTQSVTIPVGATSGTAATPLSVAPSATGYTISETPDPRYSAASPSTTGSGTYCGSLTPTIGNSRVLGHIVIHKVLSGPVAGAPTTFSFDVACPGVTGYPVTASIDMTRTSSWQSDNNIPTGVVCTVTEDTLQTGTYWTDSGAATATAATTDSTSNTATITNTRNLGAIVITKSLSGPVAGAPTSFTFDVSCPAGGGYDGLTTTGTVDPVNGPTSWNSGSVIPVGVQCSVTEDTTSTGTYWSPAVSTLTAVASATTSASNTAAFTNVRQNGHIVITKAISGPVSGAPTSFTFDVSCPSADSFAGYTETATIDPVNGTDSWTSPDTIPVGVTCTVTEDTTSTGQYWSPVAGSLNVTASQADGTGNTAAFTNDRVQGHIVVAKSLSGDFTGLSNSYAFTVDCPGVQGYPTTLTVTTDQQNDTYGETSSADNIPVGVSCSVSENDGGTTFWTVSPSTGSAVAATSDGTGNTVSFTNTRNTGAVQIVKTVAGSTDADGNTVVQDGTFSFTLACPNDTAYNQTVDVTTSGGTGTVSVADIPVGLECSVTENSTPDYTVSGDATQAVTIQPGTNVVSFTNDRNTGALTISKTAVGHTSNVATFGYDVVCVLPGGDLRWTATGVTLTTDSAGDGSRTISGIPTGWSCTVDESGLPSTWRFDSVTPAGTGTTSGAVTIAGTPVTVAFHNTQLFSGLSLAKSVDQTSVAYGGTLAYSLDVTATGNQDETNVVVSDILPGYDPAESSGKTTFVAGSAVCSVTCTAAFDAATHTVTWTIASLASGQKATVSFQVTVDTPAAAADGSIPAETIRNVGAVLSTETPKTPSNVVTTTTTAVLGLKVTKPVATPTVKPAAVLPFTGSGLPIGPASIVAVMLIGLGLAMSATRRKPSVRGRHLRLS